MHVACKTIEGSHNKGAARKGRGWPGNTGGGNGKVCCRYMGERLFHDNLSLSLVRCFSTSKYTFSEALVRRRSGSCRNTWAASHLAERICFKWVSGPQTVHASICSVVSSLRELRYTLSGSSDSPSPRTEVYWATTTLTVVYSVWKRYWERLG